MARSRKFNDRNHRAEAEGAAPATFLPKFFGKNGFAGDPHRTKKNGGGKRNWGGPGSEVMDDDAFNFVHTRRRSNSYSIGIGDFSTKFDMNEAEPVFDGKLHGPAEEEQEDDSGFVGAELTKTESSLSSSSSEA
jgi:hypothetical protein